MDKETVREIVTGLITYGWMIALAMFGGLVSFIRRLNQSKDPKPLKEIFMRLVGELIISAFAGVITVLLCIYWKMPLVLIGVLAGMAGHLGSKAIDTFVLIWRAIVSGGKLP
ncbi:phage holin family protein [Acinetobacter baumannii]|nr:phage holin family protein [Acinetobacter baumannii]EKU4351618.1 phage holin family protein [Acinetobacter baumannii]ELA7620821.1 phage holin family protein [Acinetobacter baumannii]EMB4943193.1 phage holin family protein [Acinetobacter baumannii]EME4562671.1 phage holin family protein [Acinetobacter baumannii]